MFALTLVVLSTAQKAYRLTLPSEGWSSTTDFSTDAPIFEENLLGLPSELRAGDRLIAVEGVPFVGLPEKTLTGQPSGLEYQAGETVRYTVLRDGQQLDIPVPLYLGTDIGLRNIVRQLFVSNQVGDFWFLIGLAITCFVFYKRSENLTAQLLFLQLMASLASLLSWTVTPFSFADALNPATLLSASFFSHLIHLTVEQPLGLHLILSFPKSSPVLQKRWSLTLLYGLPWLPVLLLPLSLPDAFAFGLVALYNLLGIVFVVRMVFKKWPAPQTAQARWFGLGFAAANLGTLMFGLWAAGILPERWSNFSEALPYNLVFLSCTAVALLRYRLFDIDVILNRTLVYGGLTAGVVGLYALVVGGLSQLLQLQSNVGVSLFATGLVAALFNPLRQRLQRAVNRLLYGERDEPYQVLCKLSGRVEGTLEPAKVLPTMTETVAQALKLPYAAALLNTGTTTEQVASYGQATGNWLALPLTHQGETIGELRLEPRAGDTFKPAELSLLKTIAQQASVAAFTVKQTLELQRSREALVTAREEERRRLRRDLHDGLGPTLASIAMRLDAARNLTHTDPAAADALLTTLKTQARETLGDIRQLVYALRPPALDELGLVGALREEVRRYEGTGLDIGFLDIGFCGPDLLPPLSAAAEVAVYCTVQEALANVVHHAGARCVRVTLALQEGGLELTISDDGVGLAPKRRAGVGLSSMRERAEELGGSFTLLSNPAGGTTLRTWLPLPGGTERV